MLGSLGLLGVIFALVPGFIADLLYRACWGYEKGDEYERTLRAIIWSVLGLVLFGVVWSGAPNYIGVLIPGGKTPVFDWSVAVAFGCHGQLGLLQDPARRTASSLDFFADRLCSSARGTSSGRVRRRADPCA
jgi:hypothetical protein